MTMGYRVALDLVGFRTDPKDRYSTAYAARGEELPDDLPDSEIERLLDAGAIVEDGEDFSAPAYVSPTDYAKRMTGPEGQPLDPGLKPADEEVTSKDPQVAQAQALNAGDAGAGDTKDAPLSSLKVNDGSLQAEADRLGLDSEGKSAAELRAEIAEARDKE